MNDTIRFEEPRAENVQKPKRTRTRKTVNKNDKDITVEKSINDFPMDKIPGSQLPSRQPRRTKKDFKGQTLEDFTQLKSREKVLESPDVYIDSVYRINNPTYIFDPLKEKIIKTTTDIPLGMSRLFIEIISNACDNATRCYESGIDPKIIDIKVEKDMVSVKNYGLPIPVIWNPEVGKWVPEWVLTKMSTGSNFFKKKTNDDGTVIRERVKRHGGGKNGMGSTLVGYFSLYSKVIIYDHINHKGYMQEWFDGLQRTSGPQVIDYWGEESSTEFIYQLDFSKFGYQEQMYPQEAYYLFARIAADASFTCKLPVIFNGFRMSYFSILDYAKLFVDEVKNYVLHYKWEEGVEVITEKDGIQKSSDNLEVPIIELIILDTPDFGLQVGLCNSIFNVEGGIHIDNVSKYISKTIKDIVAPKKKEKTAENTIKDKSANRVSKSIIKCNVSVIINVRLPNPSFTGQTKSKLMAFVPDRDLGVLGKFTLDIPEEIAKKIAKWDLVDRMKRYHENEIVKMINKTKKNSKQRINGKHVEDCEWARKPSMQHQVMACAFEGESAKSYFNGFKTFMIDGTKKFQGISLGGKINNSVRTTKKEQLLTNNLFLEIISLCGLTWGMDYTILENFKTLRCQAGFLLMTDQDPDGMHIKILFLAFIYKYFPSILQLGLIYDWRTPIVTVSKKGEQTLKFYTKQEYEQWEKTVNASEWTIKYFKGLGTSSDEDIKSDVENAYVVRFIFDEEAGKFFETTVAGKDKISTKKWMMSHDPYKLPTPIVNNEQYVSSFINDEFIKYCLYTLGRHLPSFTDGLNDSRRKIIWYAGKHKKWKSFNNCNDKTLMRLDTFANFTMAESLYHHGDISGVVANMTQSFVGHNNVPLFEAKGQFGTRIEGGKDCASSRYPKLIPRSSWCKCLFQTLNARMIEYRSEEGQSIEPQYYIIPIPYILFTGWKGISYGYSSQIPPYHPLEVILKLLDLIRCCSSNSQLLPWYRDFKGTIFIVDERYVEDNMIIIDNFEEEKREEENISEETLNLGMRTSKGKHYYITRGIISGDLSKSAHVTELPIGTWTKSYLEKLSKWKKEEKISNWDSDSDIYKVDIRIKGMKVYEDDKKTIPRQPTPEDFLISRAFPLTNMIMLDKDNKPMHFERVDDIINEYYKYMYPMYVKRREMLIQEKLDQLKDALDDYNYIYSHVSGKLSTKDHLGNPLEKEELEKRVIDLGLSLRSHKMSCAGLTKTRLRKIEEKIVKIKSEGQELTNTSPEQMWISDLEVIWNTYVSLFGDDRPRR